MDCEHEKFIRDNIKGKTKKEMTEMFNKEFGADVTIENERFCSRKRIRSGVDCKFKKVCLLGTKEKLSV